MGKSWDNFKKVITRRLSFGIWSDMYAQRLLRSGQIAETDKYLTKGVNMVVAHYCCKLWPGFDALITVQRHLYMERCEYEGSIWRRAVGTRLFVARVEAFDPLP